MNFNITRELDHISNSLLRGGPSFREPGSTEGNLNVFTNQTKKIWMYAGNYRGYGDLESYGHMIITGNRSPANECPFHFDRARLPHSEYAVAVCSND